ncbi:sel1 repeat family protein [Candidatus Peribacteria bacterium]|nr:sel1 repeat family protein [Candidatus Peribacteria bacterium]
MKISPTPLAVLSCILLVACAKSNGGDTTLPDASSGSGSKKAESRVSIETKANKGDREAQFDLGALYHDGDGVVKDLALARKWFEKAAAQNEPHAQFNLGVMYYVGEGVTQNFAKALTLFKQASDLGNERAQFNLGVMYYRGEGVMQDLLKAHGLFTKAAMQNFGEAQFNLGVMEAKGEGIEPNIGKAYAWFSAARASGNPRSEEVIDNIEKELDKDQLKIVKQLSDDLKKEIQASVASKADSKAKL